MGLGRVTELLANELGVPQTLVPGHQGFPAVGFGGGDESEAQSLKLDLPGDAGQKPSSGQAQSLV
ncbi:MAG: hypothetical protein M5U12_28075 [Verrucomicrobia bacterium]|nr:hypothetical protein [Verrucomicrobiota bacterium]